MIKSEKNKFLSYITTNAKDEKTNEKLKNLVLSVIENRNKKVEIFKKQLKNLKTMKTMNLIIH